MFPHPDETRLSESLFTIEDLINIAVGPTNCNIINFKVLQMVLYLLARHMRILEQRVELRHDVGTGDVDKGSPSKPKYIWQCHKRCKGREIKMGKYYKSEPAKQHNKISGKDDAAGEKRGKGRKEHEHSDAEKKSDTEEDHAGRKGLSNKSEKPVKKREKSDHRKETDEDADKENKVPQEKSKKKDETIKEKDERKLIKRVDEEGDKPKKELPEKGRKDENIKSRVESKRMEEVDDVGDKEKKGISDKARKHDESKKDQEERKEMKGEDKGNYKEKKETSEKGVIEKKEKETQLLKEDDKRSDEEKKGTSETAKKQSDSTKKQDESKKIKEIGDESDKQKTRTSERDGIEKEQNETKQLKSNDKGREEEKKVTQEKAKKQSEPTKEQDGSKHVDEEDDGNDKEKKAAQEKEKKLDKTVKENEVTKKKEGVDKDKEKKGTPEKDREKDDTLEEQQKDKQITGVDDGSNKEKKVLDDGSDKEKKRKLENARKQDKSINEQEESNQVKGIDEGSDKKKKGISEKEKPKEETIKEQEKNKQMKAVDKEGENEEKNTKEKSSKDEKGRGGSEPIEEAVEKRDQEKKKRKRGSETSFTSVAVTEESRGAKGEKVLVVKEVLRQDSDTKTIGSQPTRVASVEVVTQEQFQELESAVKALMKIAPPLSSAVSTKKDTTNIDDDLPDTLSPADVAQLVIRMQQTEKGIHNLADLLEKLAASGALPEDVAAIVRNNAIDAKLALQTEGADPVSGSKTFEEKYGIKKPGHASVQGQGQHRKTASKAGGFGGRGASQIMKDLLNTTGPTSNLPITRADFEATLDFFREQINSNMNEMIDGANVTIRKMAKNVEHIAKTIDNAVTLSHRITETQALVNEYASEIAGYENSLQTQIVAFQEQVQQMQIELNAGLVLMNRVSNNAETTAVLEMTERCNNLVLENENTMYDLIEINNFHSKLAAELQKVIDTVETLKEQKADRDEVYDEIRDKVDIWQLEGVLTTDEFVATHNDLDLGLKLCYEQLQQQNIVWTQVMKDCGTALDLKADDATLTMVRDELQEELRMINKKVRMLEKMLGDPKAALLTRKLAKDALCASCRVPALMEAKMEHFLPLLPAVRPNPVGAPAPDFDDKICLQPKVELNEDGKPVHICHRWVGGSHTLIGSGLKRGNVLSGPAPPRETFAPRIKYLGPGFDGRLYRLEGDIVDPCVQCNRSATNIPDNTISEKNIEEKNIEEDKELPVHEGSDDSSMTQQQSRQERRVTIIDDRLLEERDKRDPSSGPRRRSSIPEFERLPMISRLRVSIAPDPEEFLHELSNEILENEGRATKRRVTITVIAPGQDSIPSNSKEDIPKSD